MEQRRNSRQKGGSGTERKELLSVLLGVCVSLYNLWVLCYRAILACAVDLYEVLVYDASCTDIEVSHL